MYNFGVRRLHGDQMPSLEERVAFLEGRTEEHSAKLAAVRNGISEIRADVRELRTYVDVRLGALDTKIDARLGTLDSKIDTKTDNFDAKITRHFTWLVGIQVAVLVAIVGALVSR
jgi:hypothetical protein